MPRQLQQPSIDGNSGGSGRAKRSTAGKVRTNRFLDQDEHSDASSPSHGSHRSSPPSAGAKPQYGGVVLQPALPIHNGGDVQEGLWVGGSIGTWRGNKLYAGALLANQQYLAVGSDVFLKAQPGQLQV